MYGALGGDIIGSKYEWKNIKTKEFPLFSEGCHFTDDSAMTIANAAALLDVMDGEQDYQAALVREMRRIGRAYPGAGYGGRFYRWLFEPDPRPYGSYGNGSAMRVSPCGLVARSLEEACTLGELSAAVTHDHPEGIKGAQVCAGCVWLAKSGAGREEIRSFAESLGCDLGLTLDEIRPFYEFDVSCQGTMPPAITAFLESDSYEDAVRGGISLGGDSDTIGCITGSIAWSFYGREGLTPEMAEIRDRVETYFPPELLHIIRTFESRRGEWKGLP